MKRTAGTFLLLASLGGCIHADRTIKPAKVAQAPPPQSTKAAQQYQGPYGEPISAANSPRVGMSPGLAPAGYVSGDAPRAGTDLIQAGFLNRGCDNCGITGGMGMAGGMGLHGGMGMHGGMGKVGAFAAHMGLSGRADSVAHPKSAPEYGKYGGVAPVPQMGPPGAVAAIGALPAYGPQLPVNMRSSIRFTGPEEMLGYKVTWFGPNGWNEPALIAPARYNFLQGGVYRLKVSSVPNHLDKVYYPTLEVLPGSPKTMTYLAHSSVPITFTHEDFEQVNSGNFLVKVVYLPDPFNQDLATVVGPNELISTRLEPGLDPIVEAQKRGTILLIVRMGNIDLQAPNTPPLDAPNPFLMRPPVMVPVPGPNDKGLPPVIIPKLEDGKKPNNLPVLPE
jgi:hypothetical protein